MEAAIQKEILKFSETYVQAIDRDKKTFSIAKEFEKKNTLKDLNFTK